MSDTPLIGSVNNQEEELLTGMGNCYNVCGEDFEETVRMVSRSRNRDPVEVKQTLRELKEQYGSTEKYQKLRNRLPNDFPM